jgi:HK97 family phage prohead protease
MERITCGIVEVKFAGADNAMEFSGYGAVFGNVDSYGDVISPGAFADTLASAKRAGIYPSMLLQHGGGMFGGGAEDMTPIGVWTELAEDGHGLKVTGVLADTQRGRDAYTLLKMSPRPAINGLSIGYIPKEWAMGSKPKEPRRTLKKVDLIEVSLVTNPANPKARVSTVKSGLDIRTAERALRDVGFSQREAKAILADGFDSIADLRDVETEELTAVLAIAKRTLANMKP